MNDRNHHLQVIESQIKEIASGYRYPPTPNISGVMLQSGELKTQKTSDKNRWWRRPAYLYGVILVVVFLVAFSVPSVRAQIVAFLRIGTIRIFFVQPTATPTTVSGLQQEPTLNIYPALDNLAGETSLEQAQREAAVPISLPTYPADIGLPDRVYLQGQMGEAVLLVWFTSGSSEEVYLDLLIIGPGLFFDKTIPDVIEQTNVDGELAVWTEGEHYLIMKGDQYQSMSLVVEGNILIWEKNGITYRLETDLSKEEAVKIAESLAFP